MRCLLDVNVVLDLVLDRRPHSDAAAELWTAGERKQAEIVVPAHGVTTVAYLAQRARGTAFATRAIHDVVLVPSIAAVDGAVLRRALALGWADFEDAVCAVAAEAASCDLLVTRDPADFKGSPVLVVDPVTALSLMRGEVGPGGVSEKRAPAYRARKGRAR